MLNVLVFPCGAENASEIHQALRYSVHVRLFGASSTDDHGRFLFERYHGGLPNIAAPEFDAVFFALIRTHNIDIVFPTHDSVAEYLAPRAKGMGFYLVNGDQESTAITREKTKTYACFQQAGWLPQHYPSPDAVPHWPIIIKPNRGQGGQGVHLVHDQNTAKNILSTLQVTEPLLLEYLPGTEITVDCFTDRHRRLIWVGPRTRERVRAGIAMRCHFLEPDTEIQIIAETINRTLLMRGPWFFQLKQDRHHRWKLLEICSRTGGTMVAQRARGINLPLMAIHDYLGRDVSVLPQVNCTLVERRLLTRVQFDYSFDTLYIDFDDTILINGHAAPQVMAFLYRMIERGKKIILLSRHAGALDDALAHAHIPASLFTTIIHITDGASKADFIRPPALFIDNHYPERAEVATRLGIPVFDVDAVELLNL